MVVLAIMSETQPPKKFLKKGEGLKRFAAYNPPLPVATNKCQRRQTFVKFKLDNQLKKQTSASFIPPEILYNESINLSTEIPKIAPPKIMHTPVRPVRPQNRQALGALKGNIDNLLRKIEEKNAALNREEEEEEECGHNEAKSCDKEERSSRKEVKFDHTENKSIPEEENNSEEEENSSDKDSGKEEHHDNDATSSQNISQPQKINRPRDLCSPMAGSCVIALGEKIQQIETTVNELINRLKNCECCADLSAPRQTQSSRPTTRMTTRSKAKEKKRPSADADNTPTTKTTPKIYSTLRNDVAQLKARIEAMRLNQ